MLCEEISLVKDKGVMGVVKDLITSDHMMIERKGLDVVPARNCLRMIITNNDDTVIPADSDDRRFLVLQVSGEKVGDFEYFAKLQAERENGGPAALFKFLLEYDYSAVELDPPPIKESRMDRYFAIHNRSFIGGILNGEEISYGGGDYREAASG